MKRSVLIAIVILIDARLGAAQWCINRPANCNIACQYGYQQTLGTCACACYDPCKGVVCNNNEVCIAQRSQTGLVGRCRQAIAECPYAVPVNQCNVSPCLLTACSVDRGVICIPNYCGRCSAHYFERNSGQDVTLTRCNRISPSGPQTKPGSCPTLNIGFCLNECGSDADCEGSKKCCSNGCGRLCVSGVTAKSGTCPSPSLSTSGVQCRADCQYDQDCQGNRKCCYNGCANVCLERALISVPAGTSEPGGTPGQATTSLPAEYSEPAGTPAPAGSLEPSATSEPVRISNTACVQLRSSIISLPSGYALDGYVPSCKPDGQFARVQCDRSSCWCVDETGHQIFGTKSPVDRPPICDRPFKCSYASVCNRDSCPLGFKTDDNGCPVVTCECIDYCLGVQCPRPFQICRLARVNCTKENECVPVPLCLPNPCRVGEPQTDRLTRVTVTCSQPADSCDANHWCHAIGFSTGGLCCPLPATAVRQGQCPLTAPSSAPCTVECTVDSDCSANQKCCYNGCGLACTIVGNTIVLSLSVSPSLLISTTVPSHLDVCNPLLTQESVTPSGNCVTECQNDGNCKDGEKCCTDGCSQRCIKRTVDTITQRFESAVTSKGTDSNDVVKVGECPRSTNTPRLDANQCFHGCQKDGDCAGVKKCCSTGCGTTCMYPTNAPVCIHFTAAMESLSSDHVAPFVPKCTPDGRFEDIQCSGGQERCWCVDPVSGRAIAGTSVSGQAPRCKEPRPCPQAPCSLQCRSGYKLDEGGCFLCHCVDPCEGLKCSRPSEICVSTTVQCQGSADCPDIPRCVVNSCPSGAPSKDNESGRLVQCESADSCPSGFWCYNVGFQGSGVCCPSPARQAQAGRCPSVELVQLGSGGACFKDCTADDNCSTNQKCCFNGCGLSCVTPSGDGTVSQPSTTLSSLPDPLRTSTAASSSLVTLDPPLTSVRNEGSVNCPPALASLSRCVVECQVDKDCRSTYRCCVNGCSRICAYPGGQTGQTTAHEESTGRTTAGYENSPMISDAVVKGKIGYCPPANATCSNGDSCNADEDCKGRDKCCESSCGRRCRFPYNTTACFHWQSALQTLSPDGSQFIPQCDDDGRFRTMQCHGGDCWCVDSVSGIEIPGTRHRRDAQNATACSSAGESQNCSITTCQKQCQHGWKLDARGCPLNDRCECKDPCHEITCPTDGEICVTERRICMDAPCPPVPVCKPNPCSGASNVRDNSTGQLLICTGQYSNECGIDACKFIPGEKFGLCCGKDIVQNSNRPDSSIHQLYFHLEGGSIPLNDSVRFSGVFLEKLQEFGLPEEYIQDVKLSSDRVTVTVNGTAPHLDIPRQFNFTFNGAIYGIQMQPSFRPSHQRGPFIPDLLDNQSSSTAFVGFMASCSVFVVVVIIIATAVYVLLKRRRIKRSSQLTFTLPSYSAPLYSHSETGKPILETTTDTYCTRSLPRKSYRNENEWTQSTTTGHNTTPSISARGRGNDNQLFY